MRSCDGDEDDRCGDEKLVRKKNKVYIVYRSHLVKISHEFIVYRSHLDSHPLGMDSKQFRPFSLVIFVLSRQI